MHQLVICRTEQRVAGVDAETRLIDQRLRVLDAKADREGLGLHADAGPVQHLEGVAGAVTERQNDLIGAQFLAGRASRRAPAAFDLQAGHPLLETDLAAEPFDLVAHVLDHADQPESADVRFADVEDLRRERRP
jgi:hypothetical protein